MTVTGQEPRFRNIIWDVDGTLFDTYPSMAAAMQAALADFGVAMERDPLEALARVSVDHCITAVSEAHDLDLAVLLEAFIRHYAQTRPEDQPPFPGVRAVCAAVCAAGGKNAIVTHRRRETTDALLDVHDMTSLFSGSIAGDDGYPRKPDPAAFVAALELCDLSPADTMTVGDRDIDILGGQAAGLFACLFGTPEDGLAPDRVITHFDELLPLLKGNKSGLEGE
jgi:phosphoglycolate phosphatase-like HAD superfamily hydrolase